MSSPCPTPSFRNGRFGSIFLDTVVLIPVETLDRNKTHALWRTMSREGVTALSGYPIDILQEMYTRQLRLKETNGA